MTETEIDAKKQIDDLDFLDMSEYKVVYIIYVGKDIDDKNIYQFILSNNPDDVFSEGDGVSCESADDTEEDRRENLRKRGRRTDF